jgi:hypothetical protein
LQQRSRDPLSFALYVCIPLTLALYGNLRFNLHIARNTAVRSGRAFVFAFRYGLLTASRWFRTRLYVTDCLHTAEHTGMCLP